MTIRIVCSGCGAAYQVPDNLLGKKVKCRKCEQGIAVAPAPVHVPAPPAESAPRPAAAPPPAAAPQPRKAPPPEDEVLSVLPATPRPARRRAEEDEAPPRPAKGPRRPKGHLTPLTAVAATLAILALLGAVVLATGYVLSSYFGKKGNDQARPATPTIPFFGEGPFAGPEAESFLMERRPDLEAYFRAPEEPPSGGLEFTEPPAAGAEAPKLIKNTTGQLTPAVLQKVKGSTVYLRVKSAQGESEGSGFFGGVPGVVVTNAHVVGMLARGAPAPTSVRVVRNKGEKDEATFPAKVVAVDHDADLALLSVPAKGMPAPLVVKSAQGLQETQVVYVAGFPLGELPGKSITINKYELSSLKKEKGALDKLQVHGDMQPGNSGGPLLDADGEVVGVCVAVLRNTRINFAVPGDKVCRFLDGHLAELALETPARVDGQLRVPVSVRLVDPLGRLRQVGLDVWVGKPGPGRPASRTAPAPQPGDGPRQTLNVEIREQTGRGELTLPPLPEGQAYWLQPALVNRDGGRVWLSAQVYQPPPPVERKPARLVLRPAGDWPLTLERWSALQFPDPRGRDHRALVRLEARLTDVSQGRQGDDLALSRRFTGLKEGVAVDGEVHMTRRLQRLAPHIQFLAVNRLVDGRGTAKRD
ncbi:MAG TPA: trypsin-like peptidase domain-containing protein, partial [Gemmataceae bacterium]|nr:trypsin-like peptidase domain-containing protein [Gemmataceae bacterium]